MAEQYAIEMRNIVKTFGSVVANNNINLAVKPGEILALLGENGSGKTTLMNMLSGIYKPDGGSILVDGQEVTIHSPEDSKQLGIGMVHQHFKLVEEFSAADNIWMGKSKAGFLLRKDRYQEIRSIAEKFGFDIDPEKKVYNMAVSEKQTLEIVKVLYYGAKTIILDEPTAVLTVQANPEGRGLSTRRITISTSGIIQGIYDLADNGPHMRLAVSLTTADPALREQLMPVTKSNPLPKLKEAIAYYTNKTKRRCTLEAALLSNENTGKKSAQQMIDFASGLDVHINLIPWNPVEGLPFSSPSHEECSSFVRLLENAGLNVTLRTRRGQKIGGACGQLGKISLE